MIKQGNQDTISLAACVASAKSALKIETTDSDIYLEMLANEAIRHLDTLSIFTKQICTVDIVDNQSDLPCGFNTLLGLRVSAATNDGQTCYSLTYANLPFLTSCGCDTSERNIFGSATGAFEIANGKIYYHSISSSFQTTDSTGAWVTVNSTPTQATIAFLGLNVNEQGELICYARYERAIRAYLISNYALQNFTEYPQWFQVKWERTWVAQKKWIKSTDFQDNFNNERPQIVSVVNSLISDKTLYAL